MSRLACSGLTFLLNIGFLCVLANQTQAQGFKPEEAAGRMTVAEGLEVQLIAAEPLIRQPVAIEFDDKGRLWVIQYLQYPNPSGLSRVQVDRFSRTIYDKVPDPPPNGPRGADRITILTDSDGDGRMDQAKDFLSGLNLASGLAFGRGGVYVLQAPYLLFYADRDRDDIPDGDPEVLVRGFGMEDAHSVANSLTWGPDGWLYGVQGSTVTARINGIEFQQGVWRYHPVTKTFELFAEGGGNMWGLDFDRRGELFASTNIGSSAMLHAVQGGYYWKSFGKHGPLHNPYTFGYFEHVPHEAVRGGHVAVGGMFYEADTWPGIWRGRYLAADLLDHSIHWHEVKPQGSTFRARQGGDLLRANDTWFAPSDLTLGPDGSVYVTDWHDKRTAHPDPDADWDRSNGRIYAIRGKEAAAQPRIDLATLTDRALVDRLTHPNVWHSRRARRSLTERHNPDTMAQLRSSLLEGGGSIPRLEALWILAAGDDLDDRLAKDLLSHADADVRTWTVRLLGDKGSVSPAIALRLIEVAKSDASLHVRAQLASTSARLPVEPGLEIATRLLLRDLDSSDSQIPLRLWWAIERQVLLDRTAVLKRFTTPDAWRSRMIRDTIHPRLIRRFAAEALEAGDEACALLLASAPSESERIELLAVLDVSMRGRRLIEESKSLIHMLKSRIVSGATDSGTVRMAARGGDRNAIDRVIAAAGDRQNAVSDRIMMIDLLGEIGDRTGLRPLLALARDNEQEPIRTAALRALGRLEDESIATVLLPIYPSQPERWRASARDLLLGRIAWARVFLNEVDSGRITASDVPIDQIRRVAQFRDSGLDAIVRKNWGNLSAATPEVKLAEVRRLNNDVRASVGDLERGKALFREHCFSCHRLFGEGKQVGPDLTHANRKDRDYLLVSLVDPSGVIRKEFRSAVIETRDGRVLSGLFAEQSPTEVTLMGANEERTTIRRDEIEAMAESPTSLMPEDLYRRFTPEALRDLFRYLESDPPQ